MSADLYHLANEDVSFTVLQFLSYDRIGEFKLSCHIVMYTTLMCISDGV